jgi:hypothetical protein
VACDNCQAKGCFPCPECSKSWPFSRYFIVVSSSWHYDKCNRSIGNGNVKVEECLVYSRSLLFQFLICYCK